MSLSNGKFDPSKIEEYWLEVSSEDMDRVLDAIRTGEVVISLPLDEMTYEVIDDSEGTYGAE